MGSAPLPPPKSSSACAALQRIWDLDFTPRPPTQDYPPVSSIPRTPQGRLDRAVPKPRLDEPVPSSSPLAAPYLSDAPSSTVLYLAYGSNLCAQTFLGQRGIRPVSAINVSAPSLRLTFDLPGIAYKEPCFANTAPRKIPKPPKVPPGLPDPPEIPHPPPGFSLPPPAREIGSVGGKDVAHERAPGNPQWDGGLIGVVYEVTPEDYATIVKTEGGGAAYQDILVPCIPIPTKPPGIPENPSYPELPKPFLAHTLYAPRIPNKPGGGDGGSEVLSTRDGDDDDGGDDKGPLDKLRDWWEHLLLQPIRPDPEYAQPSARYLKLIVDGAAEHDLPVEYQRYLVLSRVLADDDGRVPVWFALSMETFYHLAWGVYDRWFKPVFGDGERTVEQNEGVKGRWLLGKRKSCGDEEKLGLLSR